MSTLVMDAQIDRVLQQLEVALGDTYRFVDKAIAWEALQSPGSLHVVLGSGINGRRLTRDANKLLALVGDAVLRQITVSVMVTAGFEKGRIQDEVSESLSNTNLALIGRRAHLDDLVQKGLTHHGAVGKQTMADTVEAVIGAIHLDSGEDEKPVKRVMKVLGLWPAGIPRVTFQSLPHL